MIIAAILALLCAPAVFAQGWPLAASADGPCNSVCPDPSKKIAGFGDVFAAFTGRYLDGHDMVDLQQPFRTARAKKVRFSPDHKRIYPWVGEAVGVYDASKFFTRLQARESLVRVTTIPLVPSTLWNSLPRPGRPEEFLKWDTYFYAENGSGWKCPYVDGQWRLWDVDVDDAGYVYIAYSVFGWGIVKDAGVADGSMMSTAVQQSNVDDGNVINIMAIKSSTGYYALTRQNHTKLWKLSPGRTLDGPGTEMQFSFDGGAKTSDMSRIALLVGGQIRIYNPDDLVTGRGPTQTFGSSLAPSYTYVTSDGTKFWASSGTSSGLVLASFSPNGSGGYTQQEFQTGGLFAPMNLQASDNYVVLAGSAGYPVGPWDVALFKIVGGQPQRVDFKNYFSRYYGYPPAGYATPSLINLLEAAVYHNSDGKSYLFVCGLGLGDVYELKDPGSVSLDPPAPIGTPNSRRSADATAGPGPFYGDLLRFTARSAAPAISWDFGDGMGMPNTTPATAGTFVQDHRYGYSNPSYSGPPGGLGDPLPKTFTTAASSTTSTATTSFLMQRPVPRFGVSGYKYLFKQPDASSTAPIVYGDSFFDASDGDIDGHYALWSVDGIVNKLMPSTSASTGDTCGRHVLDFEGHYGANAQQLVVTPDYTTAIRGFTYGVTPFAASIDYAAGTTGVTFTAFPKATTNPSILSADQVSKLTYAWSLVNAQGVPVPTPLSPPPPNGTGISSIPSWTIDKSYFAVGGNRVQLVLTSPTAPGGTCASMTSYTASTPPLNPPDPRVDPAICPGGGPLCTLTVLSQRPNFDQAADHWRYQWSVDSTNYSAPSLAAQTFTPTFTKVGTYRVSVTVTNDVGSAPVVSQTVIITNSPPPCAKIIPDTNLLIDYGGSRGCSLRGSPCSNGEDISFQLRTWNYDLNCATHTVHWDFGDNTFSNALGTEAVTHRYAMSSASFTVKALVSNGAETNVPLTAIVLFGTPYQPPPVTGCPTIVPDNNMFVSYVGPTSGCARGGKACGTSEAVAFEVGVWGYSLGCGSHVFLWSFNDGSGAQPFGQYVTHQFPTAGTFTATVNVFVNGGAPTPLSVPVVVSGSSGVGPTPNMCPAMNPADPFVTYSGPVSHCATGGTPCQTNETIQFDMNTFQYPIACGTHEFTWDFKDGGAKPVGKNVTHVFSRGGTYQGTVSVKIDGTAIATTIPVNITIEGGARRRGSRH
jgi:PKD repeat protein